MIQHFDLDTRLDRTYRIFLLVSNFPNGEYHQKYVLYVTNQIAYINGKNYIMQNKRRLNYAKSIIYMIMIAFLIICIDIFDLFFARCSIRNVKKMLFYYIYLCHNVPLIKSNVTCARTAQHQKFICQKNTFFILFNSFIQNPLYQLLIVSHHRMFVQYK